MPGPKYSEETKERFFDALDRGGTIRAAADAAGVSHSAAYTWVRKAGLTMGRNTPRIYTAQEKAEFFRLLAEQNNVSAVARQLGFTRVTCYKCAHQAGIFTIEARKVNPRREKFLRLRADGMTRSDAAAEVDARSAADWDKGITIIHRGRIYPDGRTVRYPAPKLSDVPTQQTAIGGKVELARVEQVIHPRYLSLVEREEIRDLRRAGKSIRKIASKMERSPSTISRELRRNTMSSSDYMPHTAHRLSVQSRRRPRCPKLIENEPLHDYVATKLRQRWSPEQISHRLRKDHPDEPDMQVSTETIYQSIYVLARGELKREFPRHLRRGRSARRPRADPNTRRPRFIDPMTAIDQRPAEVEDRSAPINLRRATSSLERTAARRSRRSSSDPADFSCLATWARNAMPMPSETASSPPPTSCPKHCAARSRGTKAPRCPSTERSASPPTWTSTSAIQPRHGNEGATKTPTAFCANTSRKAPTSRATDPRN